MKELLNFRAANKFILTEEYNKKKLVKLYHSTSDVRSGDIALPKGLVFTIVTLNLNNTTQRMKCKIIRSKKIVKKVYEPNGIDPKFYTAIRYNKQVDTTGFVTFSLEGQFLVEFLNTVKVENFTSEYKRITDEYTS